MLVLLHIAEWASDSRLGVAIRDSVWLFPAIEAIHLLALAAFGGLLLVVDLSLCGVRLGESDVSTIGGELEGWTQGALVTMIVTGALLYSSEALKCYANPAFKAKMLGLLAATTFLVTVRRWALAEPTRVGSWGRIVGSLSMALWFLVGAAGRGIGFY
jgi:hypothetical protein